MDSIQQLGVDQEATLLQLAMGGSLEAFNQLVILHQDVVYNHALALLSNPELAEDATQESFIKAFQALHSFRHGSFRSWVLKIVTNSAYDVLRKSKRHPSQPLFPEDKEGEEMDSPAWIADPTASVQDIVEQNEYISSIHELIRELPEHFHKVLTLVDLYEMDYAEAADVLGVPIGTVKSRLARARLQICKKLQQVKNRQLCLYYPA